MGIAATTYRLVWTLLFLGVFNLHAQVSDDFSDGDFTNNPTWTGDDAFFIVENEMLRSNSPDAAIYLLSTPNSLIENTEWNFYINLDLATSGVNFVDVYLVADDANLELSDNAYFLRFGGTPDEISFYKKVDGVQSLLIDGEDGLIGSSSNNIFAIHVTRDGSGNWDLNYDIGATGAFNSLGNITDSDVTTTEYFGFQIEQSSAASAVNSHYFDDIEISVIQPDVTPPQVLSVTTLSETELLVIFDEPLSESSAEALSNYSVNNGIGSATSAELNETNPTEVNLSFASSFVSGTEYTLSVSGVEDVLGNAMSSQDINFLFYQFEEGTFKEVVFNEIFPDPTPAVGLPEAEYLEIFNASDSYFDLSGWTLVNTSTEVNLATTLFAPGDFLILCDEDDAPAFEDFGTVISLPSFPALSNAGDSLRLKNANGDLVDFVVYSSSWYQDPDKAQGGYSLELINPFTECSGVSNWSASNSSSGGTPGSINSIFDDMPDQSAPEIVGYELLNNQTLVVVFSEIMNQESLATGNYVWNEGITTSAAVPSADLLSATLSLSAPLQVGTAYTLVLSGMTDCVGNPIVANSSIEVFLGEEPLPGELIISEIMADPTPSNGLPEAEYFELYNNGNRALELSGCALNDKVFENPFVLLPSEYVICIDDEVAIDFLVYPRKYIIEDLGGTYLTNGGRELVLTNVSGDELDRVDYELSWYQDADQEEGGYSLERINLMEPCRGADNWSGSEADLGGTPNAQNSIWSDAPDNIPPEPLKVYVRSETVIEVVFSETLDPLSIPGCLVNISPNIEVLEKTFQAEAPNAVFITLAEAIAVGTVYELAIDEVFDCSGNQMEAAFGLAFGFPEMGEPGDVLINEVLFNPATGGVDYVEVYNASPKIIGLKGWALQNQDLTTREITEDPDILLPGDYVLFTSDAQSTYRDFPLGHLENFLEMESLPSFNNSDGSVLIVDSNEVLIDRFDYSEDYHLELLQSFKGVSLERVNFSMETNNPNNWTSAAESVGFGTPGYQNSQYRPQGSTGATIALDNKLFSPDNDGFQDLLLINYSLDTPGFLANVVIYDSRGRQIKELTNNLVLGAEGTITWDGVADNGSKARIGPHIVYVDLFTTDGRTEKFKLPCIVAGKLSN